MPMFGYYDLTEPVPHGIHSHMQQRIRWTSCTAEFHTTIPIVTGE